MGSSTITAGKAFRNSRQSRDLVLHELRLDGAGVDAVLMEEGLDLLGRFDVLRETRAPHVHAGNDPAAHQLPDVQVMDVRYACHLANGLL